MTDRVKMKKCYIESSKQETNILHTTERRIANWIGDTFHKICLLRHVTELNVKGTRRRERRLKQLLDDLRKKKEDTRT